MFVTTIELLTTVLLLFLPTGDKQVLGFNISFPTFPPFADKGVIRSSYVGVARDAAGNSDTYMSARLLYKKRFRLWNKKQIASFNSTFVLNIHHMKVGSGEGIAFILTKEFQVPTKSEGQWLGIVNANTNGSSNANIVAIEFDINKSFPEDIDSNHVGLDINSVYSKVQVSLNGSGITIVNDSDIKATVLYDSETKTMSVLIIKGKQNWSNTRTPIMSVPLDLRQYLTSDVYVGFSSSTGSDHEITCVKSWYFHGTDLGSTNLIWLWIVISVLIGMILLCGVGSHLYWSKKCKLRHVFGDDDTIEGIETGLGPKKMKLKDLKAATCNFNANKELGRGGFGIVYKGTIDGNQVAVKRINTPRGKQNLVTEVTTIGSLHHKNLVKLVGWCYEGDEFLLVYEYMQNGSLDRFLYTNEEKIGREISSHLSWEQRHNIIFGVAQALDYLHNECVERVLHRDIKPSNIMLDSEFNARLGDFGLARMFKLSEKTHHSTKEIAGTPGYMAPEIFHTGRTTAETDIFSFGVLSLVIACGRKPAFIMESRDYYNNIVDWVWELYKSKMVTNAIDPQLKGSFDKEQAECLLLLGLACCHPNPYMRPSMGTALQVLIGEAPPPLVPFDKPVFMWPAFAPFTREESNSGGILTTVSSFSGR